MIFQPALPMRGVTHARLELAVLQVISTRTPHAGSDGDGGQHPAHHRISTRTPHAGSDVAPPGLHREVQLISTRTPHAGSDGSGEVRDFRILISTRTPHAGSDRAVSAGSLGEDHFNPHSPCGE